MGIFDNIFRRLGYAPAAPIDPYSLIVPAKAQPITSPPAWLTATAAAEQYSVPDRSLPEAQLELYQRLTWVQIAVSTVAAVAATTPYNVLRIEGEGTTDIPNHPFELLLRRPNPLMSRAELLEATVAYYALTGNAYWWLNKTNGAPTELWVLPPHLVKPVPDGRLFLRGYIYEPEAGKEIPLEVQEVVHFKRFHPLNSFVGLSPIEALNTVATGDIAAQRWNTNFFDKDNAKIPGILGFRDPIPDPDWDKMKRDVNDRYGGTKRQLMMLRGMGDGVQWISTAMSQGDMQFLEGRTFTKEEVFAIYAPGLSSMLAVNATEANSVSGKRTFIEYAVWPHLVRIAEKITNDLLPVYGQGLVGEFDDIRVTDKQMELAEINAYSQTHTVDEVRAKYYQDDPLEDGRGVLLVTEVGKGITPAGGATGEQDDGADVGASKRDILGYHIETGVVTRNEARADVGLPPVDDSTDSLLRDLRAKIEVIAAAKNAGLDVESIARLVGLNNVEAAQATSPQPPPMQQGERDTDQGEQSEPDEPDDDDQEDMQHGEMQAEGRQAERQAEIKALRRWLRNRGDKADPLKFKRVHLSEGEALDVAAEMAGDGHTHRARPAMAADIEIPHGSINPYSLKAMVLQLDPDDNEAEQRIRMALEKKSTRELGRALSDMLETLYPDGWGGDWAKAETEAIRVHNAFVNEQKLKDALSRALLDAVDLGVSVGVMQLENVGFGFDWTLAHIAARDWAITYTDEVLQQLANVSEKGTGQIIARWLENGEPLDALKRDLQIIFGPARAERIAATEVTRAVAEGSEASYRESGVVAEMEWSTAEDERVCMVCGGLNEKRRQFGEPFSVGIAKPPAHVNCRCWLRPVLKEFEP